MSGSESIRLLEKCKAFPWHFYCTLCQFVAPNKLMLKYYTGATTGKAHEIPHMPFPNYHATNLAEANTATAPQMPQPDNTENVEGTNQPDKTNEGNPDDVQRASSSGDVADAATAPTDKIEIGPNTSRPIRKRKAKSQRSARGDCYNRRIKVWICAECGAKFGDRKDPKINEDWLPCAGCSKVFHETCAEVNGIIDDDDMFTCKACV